METDEEAGQRERRIYLQQAAERQAAGVDSDIDFSDIPPLTDEQLAGSRGICKIRLSNRFLFGRGSEKLYSRQSTY